MGLQTQKYASVHIALQITMINYNWTSTYEKLAWSKLDNYCSNQFCLHIIDFFSCKVNICCLTLKPCYWLQIENDNVLRHLDLGKRSPKYIQQTKHRKKNGLDQTCLIIIVDDGKAERFPFAPAAKSKAASPQALPTHRVNIGGLTYL